MLRYLTLYLHILSVNLKSMLEYRLNFLIKIFYGPAYVFVMFLLVSLAYAHTPSLFGWSKDEGLLLFATFNLIYSIAIIIFMQSVRHFLWDGFRLGELDFLLLKPANTQFLMTTLYPEVQQLPLTICLAIYFAKQMAVLHIPLFSLPFLGFVVASLLGFIICYLFITSYMVLGFYVVKAGQILELVDKMADNAQYPLPLYPQSLQLLFLTIIPIAYFSYIPTSILLQKEGWGYFIPTLVLIGVLIVVNQLLWNHALKRYSSASS